jgi:hypothetical protein
VADFSKTGVPPVLPVDVVPFGGYMAVRHDPSQGSCGVGTYPCSHPGIDLGAPPGTVVHAPADGWVWVSQAWSGQAPFGGYGPAIVLIAHDDGESRDVASQRWSLLAHLDPDTLRFSRTWEWGLMEQTDKPPGRAWWHKRDVNAWDFVNLHDSASPSAQLLDQAFYVHAGDAVGHVGPFSHVHWEVRDAPLASISSGLENPLSWLSQRSSIDWTQAPTPPEWKVGPFPTSTAKKPRGSSLVVAAIVGWAAYELLGKD